MWQKWTHKNVPSNSAAMSRHSPTPINHTISIPIILHLHIHYITVHCTSSCWASGKILCRGRNQDLMQSHHDPKSVAHWWKCAIPGQHRLETHNFINQTKWHESECLTFWQQSWPFQSRKGFAILCGSQSICWQKSSACGASIPVLNTKGIEVPWK